MFRLILAIAIISISGCLSWEYWPAQVVIMAVMWTASVLHGARVDQMLRRLALFLPFVFAIGIGIPLTQDGHRDWDWTLTILFRSLVAFFVGLWLVHAMPFPQLLSSLRRAGMPELFLGSLAFMHRYTVVLWEELQRLKTARRARSSRMTWWRTWWTSAQMIGELLIRAWDRAERVHRAMLARGGDAQHLSGSPT